jgi:hypothetical protein
VKSIFLNEAIYWPENKKPKNLFVEIEEKAVRLSLAMVWRAEESKDGGRQKTVTPSS